MNEPIKGADAPPPAPSLAWWRAWGLYEGARLLGNKHREAAIVLIRYGILSMGPKTALADALKNVERTTRSDFATAHFYDLVAAMAREMIRDGVVGWPGGGK